MMLVSQLQSYSRNNLFLTPTCGHYQKKVKTFNLKDSLVSDKGAKVIITNSKRVKLLTIIQRSECLVLTCYQLKLKRR